MMNEYLCEGEAWAGVGVEGEGPTRVGVMEGVGPGINITGGDVVVTASMDEVGERQKRCGLYWTIEG